MQLQSPVILSDQDEPEPDCVILQGNIDDYKLRKPEARGALCIIEVADSSLLHDRTDKLSLYANAGIPQYLIVNLPDRVIEVYTEPQAGRGRYGQAETLRAGLKVQFQAGANREIEVPVKTLLP